MIDDPYAKYRTFWARVGASLLDGLILLPLFFIYWWLWSVFEPGPVLAASDVLYSLAYVGYTVVCHGLWGQTLGKRWTRVKVLHVSEGPLGMKHATARSSVDLAFVAVGLVSSIPMALHGPNPFHFDMENPPESSPLMTLSMVGTWCWLLAEFVTMLFNQKRRALHDFLGSSVVVLVQEMEGLPAPHPVASATPSS